MISFSANVVVGIRSKALLNLEAKVSEGYEQYGNSDYTPKQAVLEDIDGFGVEEWFDFIVTKIPEKEGMYSLTGNVKFTEDDADYENVNLEFTKEL